MNLFSQWKLRISKLVMYSAEHDSTFSVTEIKSHPIIGRAKFLIQCHTVGVTRERFLSLRHYTGLVTQSLFYTKHFVN